MDGATGVVGLADGPSRRRSRPSASFLLRNQQGTPLLGVERGAKRIPYCGDPNSSVRSTFPQLRQHLRRATCAESLAQSNLRRATCTEQLHKALAQSNLHRRTCTEHMRKALARSNWRRALAQSNLLSFGFLTRTSKNLEFSKMLSSRVA